MKILHISADPHAATLAFKQAVKFSTGTAHHSTRRIEFVGGGSIRFVSIADIDEARQLAGLRLNCVMYDKEPSEDVQTYLRTLVRP